MTTALLIWLLAVTPGEGLAIELVPRPGEDPEKKVVPVAGGEIGLRVTLDGEPAGGAVVTAVYRPGSKVELFSEVGITRKDGTIEWLAEHPGLARIDATLTTGRIEGVDQTESASRSVAVRFRGTPWSGVLVFLAAGIFLFGGAALSLKKLLS